MGTDGWEGGDLPPDRFAPCSSCFPIERVFEKIQEGSEPGPDLTLTVKTRKKKIIPRGGLGFPVPEEAGRSGEDPGHASDGAEEGEGWGWRLPCTAKGHVFSQ